MSAIIPKNKRMQKTLKKLWCKILGHKFGGYQEMKVQAMPEFFYCKRCKEICSVSEGWD